MKKSQIQQEKVFKEQSKIRNEIKTKIDISRAILAGLKRNATQKNADATADAAGATGAAAAGGTETKKKDSGVFDPSKLLKKLRSKIKQIHIDQIGQGEVDSKATLALLNEIESVIIRYTRKIQ